MAGTLRTVRFVVLQVVGPCSKNCTDITGVAIINVAVMGIPRIEGGFVIGLFISLGAPRFPRGRLGPSTVWAGEEIRET